MAEENKVRDAADAVKGIFETVPVYQDLLQPAAKEIGTGLLTVAKTIHIALAPVAGLVWGYDQIRDYVTTSLAEKFKKVPQERLIKPSLMVAGPALEAMRFAGHEPTLRELYANLLATAMDAETASEAHPAFAEILKQLTPDEARILELFTSGWAFPLVSIEYNFLKPKTGSILLESGLSFRNFSLLGKAAGCSYLDLTSSYLDNLCRLGLTEVTTNQLSAPGTYEPLERHPDILELVLEIESNGDKRASFRRKAVFITDLGKQFCNACIIQHDRS